jgi:hypothetical protein
MRNGFIAAARRAPLAVFLALPALAWSVVAGTPGTPFAQSVGPAGDYHRAVLVSWDGVRRDVLFDLLSVSDPTLPCWENAEVFPVATGRTDAQGKKLYTCLPALAGARPADAGALSPAHAPFQMLASHTTNDGNTMTKPRHASLLTGLNAETHGLPADGPAEPMPAEDVVPNILATSLTPTLLDMFGVEWRSTTGIEGISLYNR